MNIEGVNGYELRNESWTQLFSKDSDQDQDTDTKCLEFRLADSNNQLNLINRLKLFNLSQYLKLGSF